MTARDDLAALWIATALPGLPAGTNGHTRKVEAAAHGLDLIADLATDPVWASTVFDWLVEAGVLAAALDEDGDPAPGLFYTAFGVAATVVRP